MYNGSVQEYKHNYSYQLQITIILWCNFQLPFRLILPTKIMQICVEAHYNVSISVHSFSNPTSKCATCNSTSATSIESLGCCDNYDNLGTCSGDELCDPGFYFCLLPLNGMSFRDCVKGIGATTIAPFYQGNTTSVFSSSNRFSGLDVPFMLSGISNEWTVSILLLNTSYRCIIYVYWGYTNYKIKLNAFYNYQ